MEDTKEFALQKAMVSEEIGRYEDMVEAMRSFVNASKTDLNDNERKLLSNAYKSVIGKVRSSWRIILSVDLKFEESSPRKPSVQKYQKIIVADLYGKCKELLDLLELSLIPKAVDADSKVFFLKMKADHLRYLAEVSPDEDELKEKSKQAYLEATEISEKNLPPAHPFRLGLALNFSVFMYEIQGATSEAYQLAEKAYVEAEPELENLHGSELEDTSTMMQLLRDNLTFWNEDKMI